MNPKVQNVAPAPVCFGAKCLINGRGERIRTSGPCLPKAWPLRAHGGFAFHPPAIRRMNRVLFTPGIGPRFNLELSAPVLAHPAQAALCPPQGWRG